MTQLLDATFGQRLAVQANSLDTELFELSNRIRPMVTHGEIEFLGALEQVADVRVFRLPCLPRCYLGLLCFNFLPTSIFLFAFGLVIAPLNHTLAPSDHDCAGNAKCSDDVTRDGV